MYCISIIVHVVASVNLLLKKTVVVDWWWCNIMNFGDDIIMEWIPGGSRMIGLRGITCTTISGKT